MEEPLIIFTVAPTGLGHIRVMNALQEGLPQSAAFEVIGLQNREAGKIHSLGSRVPLFAKITEFYQTNAFAEQLVSELAIQYWKTQNAWVIDELAKIAKKYTEKKCWIIVSTHFALAYAIGARKKELMEKFGVEIMLCVVVTDDSPQRVWEVTDADLVFAPSKQTANELIRLGMPPEKMKVVSYPISPKFAQKLPSDEYQLVVSQLDPKQTTPLQIVIPVSGAAVQLQYLEDVIKTLSYENFFFTVVGQDSLFTFDFFEKITQLAHVQTSIGLTNLQTVEYYESLFYQPSRPAVEITKPSEQTFKALLKPNERGGVILLFTQPVGRQEKDNLQFLERHHLIPDLDQQQKLESGKDLEKLREEAAHWRGMRLPDSSQKAAELIKNLKQFGIFSAMLGYVPLPESELMSNGVEMIWQEIREKSNFPLVISGSDRTMNLHESNTSW